ncbi:MAG TPA: hypothetical protein VHZ30_06715 [Verrucomicrobiae bacterium]|nr:hypothetical protein [Verrucomicrobiae bacterium]
MNVKATTGLLVWLPLFALNGTLRASAPRRVDDANPYTIISERNVFHLKPIPPPPALELPKVELPDIKLSGFLKIGKSTHVLFACISKDKKKEPIYYDLSEGQKDGIVEVLKIREEKGEVDILNSGMPATLTLKSDSLELAGATPNKPAAKSRLFPSFNHAAEEIPRRSAYQFPGTGQGASRNFSFPMRRTRLNQ